MLILDLTREFVVLACAHLFSVVCRFVLQAISFIECHAREIGSGIGLTIVIYPYNDPGMTILEKG